MFTTIDETLEWIHHYLPHGIKPGTERMEAALVLLGHPERRIKAVHIGGTNGKGSTVNYTRMMLQKAGYKVGAFTSPYIVDFNERITVNGEGIYDQDLIEAANLVRPVVEELEQSAWGSPTEFEVVTLISLVFFGKLTSCDIVLYEVGLGGRADSTNVIHPLVSVITNIGHDHMKQLGDTLQEIAGEKAGIIKSGIPVITGVSQPEARSVIVKTAKEKRAKLYELHRHFETGAHQSLESEGERFDYQSLYNRYEALNLSMTGEHQIDNAAISLMIIDYLKTFYAVHVEEDAIRQGLEEAHWPGRFEIISTKPLQVLDGAHNLEGIEALVRLLKRDYKNKKIHVLMSAVSDKQYGTFIKKLQTVAARFVLTTFDFERAISAPELKEAEDALGVETDQYWESAYQNMKNALPEDGLLLITGSLYFISEVRKTLNN